MKSMYSAQMRPLSYFLALVLIGLLTIPALAQETETRIVEGQEYKMKFNEAVEQYKAKKYDAALTAFEQAVGMAQSAGDASVEKLSRTNALKLSLNLGNRAYKAEQYDTALSYYQKGIEMDNSSAGHHFGKGKVIQKTKSMEEALPIFQAVMGMDDRESTSAAEKTIRGHFVYVASSALGSNGGTPSRAQAQTAVDAIDEMEMYVEPDADAYYYRAEASKVLGDYAQAIELADKALSMHRGSRTDAAKIHFTKGEAMMLQGSTQGAMEAFTNALYGDYKPLAQHYLDELKGSGN